MSKYVKEQISELESKNGSDARKEKKSAQASKEQRDDGPVVPVSKENNRGKGENKSSLLVP